MSRHLRQALEETRSLMELGTRLGAICLDRGRPLARLRLDPAIRPVADYLERVVASMDEQAWLAPPADGGYLPLLGLDSLDDAIALAELHDDLECIAVLRGLCHRVFPMLYLATEGQVELDRGTPVPFATRPINTLFRATPHQITLNHGHALDGLAFTIFQGGEDPPTRVVLDFSHRDAIDALTWGDAARLPRIATVHPDLSANAITIDTIGPDWFFGVRPTSWDLRSTLTKLEQLRDIEIAVLPELCLPHPDALTDALRQEPNRYPRLIVAGSAHVREGNGAAETRANESRVYLDGKQVLCHRKIHPYHATELKGERFEDPLPEGLTGETKTLTVLSGTNTRLAVAICADLNDRTFPALLEAAGVNLLLVPSLSNEIGAFNGALCGLASRCQAVSVVANAALAGGDTSAVFAILVAVPRPKPAHQSRTFTPRHGDPPYVAVIDPNQPLGNAVTWM